MKAKKDNAEYVTFSSLQDCFKLNDPGIFRKYLMEVFNDLADLKDKNDQNYLGKISFYDYINLPIFISEKVFNSFSKSTSKGLTEKEFVDNLFKLYKGSFHEIIEIIFNILDYDKDQKIVKEDIKMFLSHLLLDVINDYYGLRIGAINQNGSNNIYDKQKESLNEANNILNEKLETMQSEIDLMQFTEIIIHKNSKIFLTIICFLYNKMTFNRDNYEAFKIKFNQIKEDEEESISQNNNNNINNEKPFFILIKIPQVYSLLYYPIYSFCRKYSIKKLSFKEAQNLKKIELNKMLLLNNNHQEKNDNKILYNNKLLIDNIVNNNIVNNNRFKTNYENWIYRVSETSKLRKFYLAIINKELYYYESEEKLNFCGMHNIAGCFVEECNSKKNYEGKDFYSFQICYKNKRKEKIYLCETEKISKKFVERIKRAIGNSDISELYEIKELIGKGKFGDVHLGIYKKTGINVAIKIINKEKVKTLEEKEFVRNEIGILKICHHPNIINFLHSFENKKNIYIVLEYIPGDNLENYLRPNFFILNETKVANIMGQISDGVKYLQQYGIIHKDLKPANIMIMKQEDSDIIKITDFGLSRIIFPNEKIIDRGGTLFYSPPELFLDIPQNKKGDIWALGVVLYYLLSRTLPFRGKSYEEVVKKIVKEEVIFDSWIWESRSQIAQDLIKLCLDKSLERRINIDDFINHPWMKKYRTNK